MKGRYGSRQKFPLIPVSDGAGAVEAVGVRIRQFAVGDRVGSFFETGSPASRAKRRCTPLSAAQWTACSPSTVAGPRVGQTPPHLDDAEAAALPSAGLTAWSAVVKLGGVRPGQTVLTQGSGGVSRFALQFAKMCGARVIATSSRDAKIERLKSLGADVTKRMLLDWKRSQGCRKRT